MGERDDEDIRGVRPLDVAGDAALIAGVGNVGCRLAGLDVRGIRASWILNIWLNRAIPATSHKITSPTYLWFSADNCSDFVAKSRRKISLFMQNAGDFRKFVADAKEHCVGVNE